MKRWVTADWHLGHKNIIRYCNRPFKNVTEMDRTIIENHNSAVGMNDIVYFLGDFCFYSYPQNFFFDLNGNWQFVKGNHDKQSFFKSFPYEISVLYGKKSICMRHDPNFIKRCDLNLCGHVHEKWREREGIINVGVDVWDFKPVNLDVLI